jgi:hypothetical protein
MNKEKSASEYASANSPHIVRTGTPETESGGLGPPLLPFTLPLGPASLLGLWVPVDRFD